MSDVARGNRCPAGDRNARYQGIPKIHGLAGGGPSRGENACRLGRCLIDRGNATFQVVADEIREGALQEIGFSAGTAARQTEANFEDGDGGRPDRGGIEGIKPSHDGGIWLCKH